MYSDEDEEEEEEIVSHFDKSGSIGQAPLRQDEEEDLQRYDSESECSGF